MAMSDEDEDPVVQRMLLGDLLRGFRESAKLTLDEANAQVPRWYKGKLGKVEIGELRITGTELDLLLELYRASGRKAAQARKLAEDTRRKTSPSRVPHWAKQHVSLERSAAEVRMWFGEAVPGTLQTRDYARAQLAHSLVLSPSEVEPNAREREQRGDLILADTTRRFWFLLGEEALRRPFGPPELMRAQLQRLRSFADKPNVVFRVVPLSAGPHVGLGYPFILLYLERADRTIAYVESLTNADYLPKPKQTDIYALAFTRILDAALSEQDTLALLDEITEE